MPARDGKGNFVQLDVDRGTGRGRKTADRSLIPAWHSTSAAAGFDSYALSFRGHGASEGSARLPYTTLDDYVEDLDRTVRRLARPLVVIGFSLGGAVLQSYLMRRPNLAGGVLMASAALRLFFRDTRAWSSLFAANQLGLRHTDAVSLRRALFTKAVDLAVYAEFLSLAEKESPLVGM